MKIKNFCVSTDTINRVKMQPTEKDKIFGTHISNKGLILEYTESSYIKHIHYDISV